MDIDHHTAPRLFVTTPLAQGQTIPLDDGQSHHLMTVMRRNDGDVIRLFNGVDGEFSAIISKLSKKKIEAVNLEKIRSQPAAQPRRCLYFCPIKKDRMAFMIEKAVELGVTDLYPIQSLRTDTRHFKVDKIEHYITEAIEQCERMTRPTLHPLKKLHDIESERPIYVAAERQDGYRLFPHGIDITKDISMMIGPEGGWTKDEQNMFCVKDAYVPVSLGDAILRAETAALFMLAKSSLGL